MSDGRKVRGKKYHIPEKRKSDFVTKRLAACRRKGAGLASG